MNDGAQRLHALIALCFLAFLGFAIAGFLDSSERGVLHASATAFLIGAALGLAADRALAEQARKLESFERRLNALEGRERAKQETQQEP